MAHYFTREPPPKPEPDNRTEAQKAHDHFRARYEADQERQNRVRRAWRDRMGLELSKDEQAAVLSAEVRRQAARHA